MGCACVTKTKDVKYHEVDLVKTNLTKELYNEANNNSNNLTYQISTNDNLPNVRKKSFSCKDVSKQTANEIQLSGPIFDLLKKKVEHYHNQNKKKL